MKGGFTVPGSCQEKIQVIDSAELHGMLEGRKEELPLLIDVRQPEEYKEAHIPGALLVPLGQLEYGHPSFSHEKTMVAYCRSGKRSMTAALILCRMGYTQVMSLDGGILQWPYELVSGPPRPTLQVGEVGNIRELILLGLMKEIETWVFYQEGNTKVKNPELKRVINFLIDMEKGHMEELYSRYSAISREEKRDIPDLEMLQQKYTASYQTKMQWNELDGETAILESAVMREYQKYDFYKLSADNMKEEAIRILLYELALEERAHASLLLKMIGRIREGNADVF